MLPAEARSTVIEIETAKCGVGTITEPPFPLFTLGAVMVLHPLLPSSNPWNPTGRLLCIYMILSGEKLSQVLLLEWNALLEKALSNYPKRNRAERVHQNNLGSWSPKEPAQVPWVPHPLVNTMSHQYIPFI